MKNSKALAAMVAIAFVLAIGAMAGRTADASGPNPINLGTAANFSVLAGTPSITNVGGTTIDKDVGISPADSVIGFPPGIVGGTIHTADAVALQAKADLTAAYLQAAGIAVTANHTELGGLTLVGGVYNSGSAVLDLTGTLTLNGQGDPKSVWVFQAQSSLVTASSSSVSFINGAQPCHVFWQVTSSATLGSDSNFVGTIMALTSITLANGVTVNGRALARNGLVSLINDRFTSSACNQSTQTFVPPTPHPTVAPSATPAVAPSATPAGATSPTVAPTAAGLAGTRNLPSTSTGDPMGPLTMLGLALTGIGILLLRGRPVRHL